MHKGPKTKLTLSNVFFIITLARELSLNAFKLIVITVFCISALVKPRLRNAFATITLTSTPLILLGITASFRHAGFAVSLFSFL